MQAQKCILRKLLILNTKSERKLALEHKLADLAQKRAETGVLNKKKACAMHRPKSTKI